MRGAHFNARIASRGIAEGIRIRMLCAQRTHRECAESSPERSETKAYSTVWSPSFYVDVLRSTLEE